MRFEPDALLAVGRYLKSTGYRYTTPTPMTNRRVNGRPENAWAGDAAGILGWSRPFHLDSATATLYQLLAEAGVLAAHEDGWRSLVRASTIGTQLYFHSAFPTREEDAVFFGPDTYRFLRAIVANLAACEARGKPQRIIEIGCGGAPAAIALALRYPEAEVVAADVNPLALQLSQVNAHLNGAANLRVCESDVLQGVDGEFDLIVSTPPYVIDEDQRTYRDGGGELGAGLSLRIVDEAIVRLAGCGTLMLYTGSAIVAGRDRFQEAACRLLERAGLRFDYDEIDPDIFGEQLGSPAYRQVERTAAVILTAQKN
jgi:methylase of polypeptide subunit release factors